jgi:YD repeat-containing protein
MTRQAGTPRQPVTQVRTWNYDAATQRLTSMVLPETGTTSYTYNGDGSVDTVTDAAGRVTKYVYDTKKRVIEIRDTNASGNLRVKNYYDTPLDAAFSLYTSGRLAAVEYWTTDRDGFPSIVQQKMSEMYSYTPWGALAKKRLRLQPGLQARTYDLDLTYTFDGEGRVQTMSYPMGGWMDAQWVTAPPKLLEYQYDAQSRPSQVIESTWNYTTQSYVAANQVTTVGWGAR